MPRHCGWSVSNSRLLYFSDRPVRVAGHLTMAGYLDEWKATEGPNNFGSNPPNATLSVYEPRSGDNSPRGGRRQQSDRRRGYDLVYNYKVIEGALTAEGRCHIVVHRLDRRGRRCRPRLPWRRRQRTRLRLAVAAPHIGKLTKRRTADEHCDAVSLPFPRRKKALWSRWLHRLGDGAE